MEYDIIGYSWSGPFVKWEGIWYSVYPAKETNEPAVGTVSQEEHIAFSTIHPGDCKEFSLSFLDKYGAVLPAGEYRVGFSFQLPSDPPTTPEQGSVWVDFTIEE